jgi:hypothetical protein
MHKQPCRTKNAWQTQSGQNAINITLFINISIAKAQAQYHWVDHIYRVITSVPTFFVRVLGKLPDARIPLDSGSL